MLSSRFRLTGRHNGVYLLVVSVLLALGIATGAAADPCTPPGFKTENLSPIEFELASLDIKLCEVIRNDLNQSREIESTDRLMLWLNIRDLVQLLAYQGDETAASILGRAYIDVWHRMEFQCRQRNEPWRELYFDLLSAFYDGVESQFPQEQEFLELLRYELLTHQSALGALGESIIQRLEGIGYLWQGSYQEIRASLSEELDFLITLGADPIEYERIEAAARNADAETEQRHVWAERYSTQTREASDHSIFMVAPDFAASLLLAIPTLPPLLLEHLSTLPGALVYRPKETVEEEVQALFYPVEAATGAEPGAYSKVWVLVIEGATGTAKLMQGESPKDEFNRAVELWEEMREISDEELADIIQADLKPLALMAMLHKVPGAKKKATAKHASTKRSGKKPKSKKSSLHPEASSSVTAAVVRSVDDFDEMEIRLFRKLRGQLGKIPDADETALLLYLEALAKSIPEVYTGSSLSTISRAYRYVFGEGTTMRVAGSMVRADVRNLSGLIARSRVVHNIGSSGRMWDASILKRYPNIRKLYSIDIDAEMASLTIETAETFGVQSRHAFVKGDYLRRAEMSVLEKADLIFLNNPNTPMQMMYSKFLREMDHWLKSDGRMVIMNDNLRFDIYGDLVRLYGKDNVAVFTADEALLQGYFTQHLQSVPHPLMYVVRKP